jgi:hypothetical protein
VLLQVTGDIEGLGRMLACYATVTRARMGRPPVPSRPTRRRVPGQVALP